VRLAGRDLLTILAIIPLTAPWNLSGRPAISVPCGFTGDGLPLAWQITGHAWEEARVCRIAAADEQATP
jgi:Asp-tRNA(Asn)/Glu-tRNA(Gln) amidotransferase A subunit family amidase